MAADAAEAAVPAARAAQDGETIRVSVRRSDSGDPAEFVVRRSDPMMVLDVLLAIQREHDPSLGFRFSCRVAMCGTCTVRVDGKSVLACQTPVEPGHNDLRIAPAAGLPVVRDLIVDWSPFWEQWASVTPYLVPREGLDEPAVIPPDSAERKIIDPSLDCIACGVCYSACGIAESGRDFLGPAALNRAMVLVTDSRDAATERRLDRTSAADGVDRCHYMYGCTMACPKGLDPAGSIRRLRRARLKAANPDD